MLFTKWHTAFTLRRLSYTDVNLNNLPKGGKLTFAHSFAFSLNTAYTYSKGTLTLFLPSITASQSKHLSPSYNVLLLRSKMRSNLKSNQRSNLKSNRNSNLMSNRGSNLRPSQFEPKFKLEIGSETKPEVKSESESEIITNYQ